MAEGLYRYPELISVGLSRAQVRRSVDTGRIHRLSRGVYGPTVDRGQQLTAIFRRLPNGVVVGFQTGARLHGFGAETSDDVHVIVPAGLVVPRIRGVVTHESVLPVQEPVLLEGVPCAPAARCAVDLARSLHRMNALPLLDRCLRVGACRPDQLRAEVTRHARLRAVCQARQLIDLADPRAECRQESQLRLLLVDGGLPAPDPQLWVRDEDGICLYRLDLGYRKRRIGIEYDGSSHLDRERLRHDRSRMNWLAAHGWRMRYFTDLDLYRRPAYIISTIAALFAS
ncbi:type IV toxin-antitoxin system AbiEi family antitoxin domain-containing protein [Micromonospora sp. DSM 115977]|uniref:Type IV toxin-antitoxin system AbiEi family antitoxin domain-containing protein n=1 Tax=Micromonospora reichwaldensis TaxID=3075516 RepID=A0ABU2X2Y9_9ACTN|nr:type IV toxin-antitoxin system AbiEi family antitoxin domain-containing protein [Micromonospora sp. DSM 115977]MDT0532575.1 type IV toxin-antitoxin system AbiEi family antitoxin domain-containing protein [Micromonospora sp. DSM 115977]